MMNAVCKLTRVFLICVMLCFLGCGSGGEQSSSEQTSLAINVQPVNQSVPMGLTGSFTVQASGSNLHFQWSRGGSPIPGATGSSYTTGATAFSDTGSTFSVIISNTTGSITSQPATLTVTARAPMAGDLRFQQVDALSTIKGYTVDQATLTSVACPPPGGGGYELGFGAAIGTPIFLINSECSWQFDVYALPASVSGLEAGYAGVALQNYQNLLGTPITPSGATAMNAGSVITSLYLDRVAGAVGLGFVHSTMTSGFLGASSTVQASTLQAVATQEGLLGHVLTAISYDGTQVTYFSYGWTNDPSTVFEAKVLFASDGTATDQIKALASEGYILTASGSTQASDGSGVILLGTRVQGDTMPRPLLIGDVLAGTAGILSQQGYATVAVVSQLQSNKLIFKNYIGER